MKKGESYQPPELEVSEFKADTPFAIDPTSDVEDWD
jgi:hypothetical protein